MEQFFWAFLFNRLWRLGAFSACRQAGFPDAPDGRFQGWFCRSDNLHFEVADDTSFEAAIVKFLDEKQIELLAMVIHKRNFFKELFNYNFTKNLAYHLATPILAIQAGTIKNLSKGGQQLANQPAS